MPRRNLKVQLHTALEGLRIECIFLHRNGVLTIFSGSIKSLDFYEFSLMYHNILGSRAMIWNKIMVHSCKRLTTALQPLIPG